jgi:hypothetical protein
MHPIHHGNMGTVSKIGPMIAMGSAKAQGSMVKHIYVSKLPKATRVRAKMTQRLVVTPDAPLRGPSVLKLCI